MILSKINTAVANKHRHDSLIQKLEISKQYLARDGRVITIIVPDSNGLLFGTDSADNGYYFRPDGKYITGCFRYQPYQLDLIKEKVQKKMINEFEVSDLLDWVYYISAFLVLIYVIIGSIEK